MEASVFIGLGILILAIFAVMTVQRNHVWGSAISLWEDTALKSPLKPRPRAELATAYAEAGRLDEAIREYDNAILLAQSTPDSDRQHVVPRTASNIGSVLTAQGRSTEAEAMLSKAWADYPGHPGIAVNLAGVLLGEARKRLQAAEGVTSDGIAAWERGVHFEAPGYLYWNRGNALFMLGDCARAQQDFQTAKRLEADFAELKAPACSP